MTQHKTKQLFNKRLKITVLPDSSTLFNFLIRNNNITEKRLLMDTTAAREAYNERIVDDIIWIRRKFNTADSMMKPAIPSDLVHAVQKRKIHYEIEQSIKK